MLFRIAIVLTAARISSETGFSLKASEDKQGKTKLDLKLGEKWLSEHPLTSANFEYEMEQLKKVDIELCVS